MDEVRDRPTAPAPKAYSPEPGGVKAEGDAARTQRARAGEVELTKRTDELFGEEPPEKADLERASKRTFERYDADAPARRVITAANAMAAAGNLTGAIEVYDRLIARTRRERSRQAGSRHFDYAEQLTKDGEWSEAAATYSKAHGLDPEEQSSANASPPTTSPSASRRRRRARTAAPSPRGRAQVRLRGGEERGGGRLMLLTGRQSRMLYDSRRGGPRRGRAGALGLARRAVVPLIVLEGLDGGDHHPGAPAGRDLRAGGAPRPPDARSPDGPVGG